jgi:cyclophilin family peptidyl-prolyl cis-trans isomerase
MPELNAGRISVNLNVDEVPLACGQLRNLAEMA